MHFIHYYNFTYKNHKIKFTIFYVVNSFNKISKKIKNTSKNQHTFYANSIHIIEGRLLINISNPFESRLRFDMIK